MSDNDEKPTDKQGSSPLPAFPGAGPEQGAPPAPPSPPAPPVPPASTTPDVPTVPQAPHAPQFGQQPPAAPQYGGPQAAAPQYGGPQATQYAAPTGPKRKMGTGALIAIVGGSILGVVVLVAAVMFGVSRIGGGPGDGGGGDDAPAAKASSPSDAVTGFLTAVADADAEKALGYLGSPPSDTSMLTDEVLAASNTLAPITGIEVPEESGKSGSADVTATYLIGGESVTTTFSALDYDDDGQWEISGGTGYIYTGSFDGLGLTINGQEVEGDEVEVFPGSYQLATTLPNFTLSGESIVKVTEPYASAETSGIEPVLTEEALQTFRGLVRESVNACIASTTLAAGCGLELPATISDGTQLTDGTITRTLDANANATLDSLKATPSYDNPTLVEGEYIGSPSVEADCTKNGTTGRCSIYFAPSLGTPSVDMASDNPTVNWD
jgi:hypothetical protein